MTKGNDPAFIRTHRSDFRDEHTDGLTKREWFAGMAMASIRAEVYIWEESVDKKWHKIRAEWAVAQADAVLAELNKTVDATKQDK